METDQMVRKPAVIFSNMPILCPWITSQPYQSTVKNKNKLNELEKKNKNHSQDVQNCDPEQIQSKNESELPTPNSYGFPIEESSSHFFYFLRLMQLFPETHPATIHTVLTLTKNNFFHAIDKLLYAKQCKMAFGKRAPYKMRTNHKQNPPKKVAQEPNAKSAPENQNFEQIQQETIVLDGNPYEVQPISKEKPSDLSTQVFEICVNEKGQSQQFDLTKLNNQEVIEIVCFQNEYDQKGQMIQKNFDFEQAIRDNNQQVVVLSESDGQSIYQEQTGGEIFLEETRNLKSDNQNFEDKMYLETDIDSDLIKIHPMSSIGCASSKTGYCDDF